MENSVLMAILTMGGLGFFFSVFLAIANQKLRVEENPLIAKVNELLPGANCGGCGFAGCYDFATKVVEGITSPSKCPVNDPDNAIEIGKLIGIEVDRSTKLVARVLCAGGNYQANRKMVEYYGPMSCSAMHVLSGGEKLCFYGCLGGGDCVQACLFGGIFMNENGLPIIAEDLCTGCGLCANACPRNVIELHPVERKIFVLCKNHDDPKTSTQVCKVACNGCGICARKLDGAVTIVDHLAVINYEALQQNDSFPVEICKSGALVKIGDNGNGRSIN